MLEKSLDTPSDTPIACTLTAADLQDRQQAWSRVGKYISTHTDIPGGLSFDFAKAPGVQQSLTELVRLEAECCAWMSFAITEAPQRIRLTITGVGLDGERSVRESFARLSRLVPRSNKE